MFRLAVLGLDDRTRSEIGRRLHRVRIQADPCGADAMAILKTPDQQTRTDGLSAVLSDPALAAVPILLVPGLSPELVSASMEADASHVLSTVGIGDNPGVWTANPRRFDPAFQAIREQLQKGNIGVPGVLRVHHWQSAIAGPRWKPWPGEWQCLVDAVLWLMGGPPQTIFALHQSAEAGSEHRPRGGSGNGHDSIGTVQLHCAWPDGGMALVNFSDQLPAGESYRTTMLIGSTGAAYYDDHQNRQLILRGGTAESILDERPLLSHVAMLQHFVDSVADGGMAADRVVAESDVSVGDDRGGRGVLRRSLFDTSGVHRLLTIAETSMASGQAHAWEES